ncbi:hypothetical protein ACEPAG_263 [Sanghuangporus baumii]
MSCCADEETKKQVQRETPLPYSEQMSSYKWRGDSDADSETADTTLVEAQSNGPRSGSSSRPNKRKKTPIEDEDESLKDFTERFVRSVKTGDGLDGRANSTDSMRLRCIELSVKANTLLLEEEVVSSVKKDMERIKKEIADLNSLVAALASRIQSLESHVEQGS